MNHLSTPQTAHSEPVRQEHTRLSGFDWLRLFAIILVTYQHACTLLRLDSWTKLYRIDVGQFGVCIFLALSAILATQDKRTPWQWLWRRFVKIMPAYWIVMLVSFLLAWLSGHKSFDIWQFISQMLGTGFFTHPHNLVNSPTWFVSLLLALYLYTFLFRFILPNSLQATVLAITYISYASLYYLSIISTKKHAICFASQWCQLNATILVWSTSFEPLCMFVAISWVVLAFPCHQQHREDAH